MGVRTQSTSHGHFRKSALRAGVAALAVLLAQQAAFAETFMPGCYKPAVDTTATIKVAPHKGPFRLALANGHAGIPWRIQMIQSVKAWAARPENAPQVKELKIVSTGPDVAAQIAAIDNFIQAGYDAIAFIAVNPKAFDAVAKRAEKAGTVLVSFDNPVDNPKVLRITPEWIEFEGDIKTQAVVDQMPEKKGKILEVRGLPGNSTDRDRHVGFRKVVDRYKDIQVVEVVGNWDTGTVQKVVSDALSVHGRFDAVVCQHGCAGVTNALAAANHPPIPVGGDAENGFVRSLAEKHFPGISVSTSPGQGPVAMNAAIALLQGKELPALVNLPTPRVLSRDLKPGVNYFPDMPNTYETVSGYAECGITFRPEELATYTPDNS